MRFVIGESSRALGTSNYRAFFHWQEGGNEVEKSYSVEELVVEIARLQALVQPTALHERALKLLRLMNR
jgi:hypothetical protein